MGGGHLYCDVWNNICVRCLKMTLKVKDNQKKKNKVQAKMVKPSNPLFHDGDAVRQTNDKNT